MVVRPDRCAAARGLAEPAATGAETGSWDGVSRRRCSRGTARATGPRDGAAVGGDFAVRTLVNWQLHQVSIDAHMATLSGYLGHVAPADTYWYLSAVPELMTLAADRLEARYQDQR